MGIAGNQSTSAPAPCGTKDAGSNFPQVGNMLLAGENAFQQVFEKAPLGMMVIGLNNRILQANSALCVLLGYTEKELQDRTFSAITYVEDVNREVEFTNQVFAGLILHFKIEKRLMTKNGRAILVKLTETVIRDSNDNPLYAVGMVEDVTERKLLIEDPRKS